MLVQKVGKMKALKEPENDDLDLLRQLLVQNRFKDLFKTCTLMLEKFPKSSKLLNIQGIAHHGLAEFDKAINCYENALIANPSYGEAYNNMGNTFKVKGEIDRALESFKKAIVLKPEFAEAYNNMGVTYQAYGEYSLAISQFQKAINMKIDFVDAYINKGNALRVVGDLNSSIKEFQKVLEIAPNSADAFFSMGLTLRDQGFFEEAIINFKKAITIKPEHFEAYNFMGNALKSVGRTERAISIFEKALCIKEDFFEIHRHLAYSKKYDGSEAQIETLLKFLERSGLSNEDQININFALAKIYDDLEDFEKSFGFLVEGNRLRKNQLNYNINDDIDLFNSVKARFEAHNFKGIVLDIANDNRKATPIFIIGMPRSGTTLIEQIISSHSNVHGAGELNFLTKSIELNDMVNVDFTDHSLKEFRSYYFDQLKTLKSNQMFITDKMPLNFRWCGFILKGIPEAKIIHVSRDRMATCFSLFKSYFSSTGNRYAYGLKDIAAYYNLYQEWMEFWRQRFPDKIYELNYDCLTKNSQKEIKDVIKFTGLKWEDQCLDYHKNERPVMTLSKTQVREKIYQGSSQKWKNYKQFLSDIEY